MTNLIDVANIVKIIKNLRNLQNSSTSKILIFWPKMTKCQTNLVRKKIFHPFFGLFSTQNHSNRKKKFLKIFHFFEKILTKNDPFWPKFRPKKPNLTKNIFFVILKSYDFQRGVTCLCLKKFNFSVPKRVVGPEFWRTGVFGPNRFP